MCLQIIKLQAINRKIVTNLRQDSSRNVWCISLKICFVTSVINIQVFQQSTSCTLENIKIPRKVRTLYFQVPQFYTTSLILLKQNIFNKTVYIIISDHCNNISLI